MIISHINLINANFEGLLLLQASANSIISGLIKYDQSIKAGLFKYDERQRSHDVICLIKAITVLGSVYNII